MKMYILVKDSIPYNMVPVICAHASLSCYLKFQSSPEINHWLDTSFKKVVCSVTDIEFKFAKEFEDSVLLTESALGGIEVALAFKPREKWHKLFNFYSLYKVKELCNEII